MIKNEHLMKITGSFYVECALDNDTDYQIVATVSTYGMDIRSNNDGSSKVTHKAKVTSDVQLIKGDKVIKGKDLTKMSQKLRQAIWKLQQEQGEDQMDDDEFYKAMMRMIMLHLDELYGKYGLSD